MDLIRCYACTNTFLKRGVPFEHPIRWQLQFHNCLYIDVDLIYNILLFLNSLYVFPIPLRFVPRNDKSIRLRSLAFFYTTLHPLAF